MLIFTIFSTDKLVVSKSLELNLLCEYEAITNISWVTNIFHNLQN